ncbi:MAG: hypothetical protein KKE20_03070 [Nanoarchaeota archaeon]|nr:hypothetical protein [Nanoarchaeota archaeon]
MSVDIQINNYLNLVKDVSPEHERVVNEHGKVIREILAKYPETDRLQAVNGIGAVLDRTSKRCCGIYGLTTPTELELGAYVGARKPSKQDFVLGLMETKVMTPDNLGSLLNGHRIPEYLVQQKENHQMMLPKRAVVRGAYF